MSTPGIVQLEALRVIYSSPLDECAFFEWLDKLPCVKGYHGEKEMLYIDVSASDVDEEGLRELLALFKRYKIDLRQFSVFDRAEFSRWFRNPKSYWFSKVFGPPTRPRPPR
jgi:hypothetical protein